MSSLIFWKNWSSGYRTAYWTGLVLLATALVGLIWAWTTGLQNVVRWDVLSELVELPATIGAFTDGLFDYPVNGKTYVVAEQFVASAMQINLLAARIVALGICLGLATILAAVTQLNRWPYLIAMSLIIILIATFRLETLQLPGWLGTVAGGRLPFVLAVLTIGLVSYYFHAFRPEIGLPTRLIVFTTLTLPGWLAFSQLTTQPFIALSFVAYAMPGLLLISLGFIFWISSEIIVALVYITSVTRTNRANEKVRPLGLNNFLFISILYLANLVLVWLSNTKVISWNPVIISPFVLVLVSLLLGIWGFRQQLQQQQVPFSFRESGAFLYLGLALITTLTLAFAFASANDPLIEALEDIIIYTHLAVGMLFVLYAVFNFWPLYRQGLPVYRVFYKPLGFSVIQTRIFAAVLFAVLLTSEGFFPFKQAVAGYFNNLGDLHAATGESRVAEQYYRLALSSEFQNHKSNYAMASLALSQGDKATAAYYFQQALLKQPSPQAYAGLTAVLLDDNLFFEAVKALQKGIRTFPKSGELQNNLGYLYAKTSVADSAYYYLAAASGNTSREDIPQTNLLAFWARNPRLAPLDSLSKATEARGYESYESNRIALQLLSGTAPDSTSDPRPTWFDQPLTDDGLSVGKFTHLYNYALLNRKRDTTLLNVLQRSEQNSSNQDFTDDLIFARAVANYYTNNKRTAFELTDQLAQDNQRTGGFYNTVTGLWMLEQGLNRKAAEMLGRNTDSLSTYYQALALTKGGDPLLARTAWQLAGKNDPGVQNLAQLLYGEKEPSNDFERAFVLLYSNPDEVTPTVRQLSLHQAIQDENLKTITASVLARRAVAARQIPTGQGWYERIPQEAKLSDYTGSMLTLAHLQLLYAQGHYDRLLEDARQPVVPSLQAEKDFLLAQTYGAKRLSTPARQAYARALKAAPFNAAIVAGAASFERQTKQFDKAYQLVLNALPMNDTDPQLLKLYTLLCLDMHLTDYAEEGLARLRAAAPPADYQAFLAGYQAKRALIEKERQSFQ